MRWPMLTVDVGLASLVPRAHLFELEEVSWVPRKLRDWMVEPG